MKAPLADLSCLKCLHRWQAPPGPGNEVGRFCPACGHLYAKWINYERDFAKARRGTKET